MPSNLAKRFPSTARQPLQETIWQHLTTSRTHTLRLFEGVNAEIFCRQADADFSPVGWHLGHIGYTEGLWLLEKEAGYPPQFPEYRRLFAADGLPKAERQNLPSFATICDYLDQIRDQVWDYLQVAPLESRAWLWYWLVQHESQHCETIIWVLQLHQQQRGDEGELTTPALRTRGKPHPPAEPGSPPKDMIYVEGGPFLLGSEGLDALDNEQTSHRVEVPPFWIDPYPVTQRQFQRFIDAGGYQNRQFWSAAGWRWLQDHSVCQPAHWVETDGDSLPVCGVSWYEAEAFTQFVGKRLPTEAEWEKAACWQPKSLNAPTSTPKRTYPWGDQAPTVEECNYGGLNGGTTPVGHYPQGQSAYGCYDLLGNVWEWTDTWFHPYPDFEPYPYQGYSMAYFDHRHRVLKGGSWATHPPVLRSTFRNWYEPRIRSHFAGFRCAYG
ncbi:SUMF1/EgtB/PvdO family nonheme iron enzyme [Acaryochloris sp. IP29b_bin.137]|uniref:SUMF1/EgtB/PvdO family nonheme iron enzyme n=1 Tax=Acaryochloris sp. IP29b_bin.137 TaxID=2969217 RepID=UPI00260D9459|nr:SUMF1/EgtB/PvdO family nonheme iron enzyme [Acaryochloris sp. IP29b_bin.137]